MSLGASVLVYQMIWLVIFFMVLPWKNNSSLKHSLKGRILMKIVLTSAFACIGWTIAYAIIMFSPFSFREEKAPWMFPEKKFFSPTNDMVKNL